MSVQTIPSYYSPGQKLPLDLNGSEETFIIIQAFTPTYSQVVVARPSRDIPCLGLSPTTDVILKIYDHAVFKNRRLRSPHEVDVEATVTKARMDPYIIKKEYAEYPHFDDDDDNDHKAEWEEWYFRRMQLIAWSESQAYQRLVPLQGGVIPIYYGSAKLDLQKIAGRYANVQVAIMEYVHDASDMMDTPKAKITDALRQSLLDAAKAFGKLGVVHNDLDAHNILFAPSQTPTRAVIIDFGMADVREGESDAEWEASVVNRMDPDWDYLTSCLRWRMNHKRLP